MVPKTSEDNQQLINLFGKTSARYTGASWEVSEEDIDWINQCLLPIKHLLIIDDSFKKWRSNESSNSEVIIRCGVTNAYIVRGSNELPTKAIEKSTRYFFKGAIHSPKYKAGTWDGYINLYKRWEHSFPTGLLHEVEAVLTQNGIPYKVEYLYERNLPKQFNWKICDGFIPDEDQIEAVEKCVKGKRGICKAPTGFGKTAILAKRLIVAHGVPALFLANKKSLLDDAKAEFTSGINDLSECSTIKNGWFGNTKLPSKSIQPLTAPVIVATIQSLSARLKDETTKPFLLDWLRNVCKFIMVDECQAVGTAIWDEVLSKCHAPNRIFLSATPRRTDGATIKLMAGSGPILFTTTAEEQIKKGRLCELDIVYNVYNQKTL